jgi:predicted permease
MKDGTSGAGVARPRLSHFLVALQVGISVVLLIGAGLMIRSARNAFTAPSGYVSSRVLLANFDLGLQGYDVSQGTRFYQAILTRLRRQTGIESVSLAQTAPSSSFVSKVSLFHPGEVPPPQDRDGRLFDLGIRTDLNPVTSGYFDTLSIARLRGRDFNDADNAGAPGVCIVSKSLAQRLWPDADATGQLIEWPPDIGPVRHLQVVGVVDDVHHRSPLDASSLMVYVPFWQEYESRATIIIRYRGDAGEASRTLVREVAAVAPEVAAFSVRTLGEQVQDTIWQQRSAARLIGLFALAAIILAATGLYGLMSYVVARRGRELGIRMALGARPAQLLWLVARQSFTLVSGGVAAGILSSFLGTRMLKQLLFGISGTDAVTFAAVAVATTMVGLAATLVPARRAARVDPLVSLKNE